MNTRLLNKFFKGTCSPEEVAEVMQWFKSEQLKPDQEQDLHRFWQEAAHQKEDEIFTQDIERLLAGINNKIDSQELESLNLSSFGEEIRNSTIDKWKWIYKVAAAIILPVCFVWLLTAYFAVDESMTTRLVTKQAQAGKPEIIKMADGSTITLHPGSKISYLDPFAAQKREITLTGEAFFEVAKDIRRPFIVRTGKLATQALGTSFNIKYRLRENTIAVALATGAVKIEEKTKDRFRQIARLEPGQQLVYERTKKAYAIGSYDSMEVLAWRGGILYFKKANLSRVVQNLESWYGVEIEIETNGMGNRQEKEWLYTGAYDNQQLEDVLAGISFVKDFTYEKKGNTWKLKFN